MKGNFKERDPGKLEVTSLNLSIPAIRSQPIQLLSSDMISSMYDSISPFFFRRKLLIDHDHGDHDVYHHDELAAVEQLWV